MKNQISFLFQKMPVFLLIPYFMVMAFHGVDKAIVNRIPNVESCLPVILSREIDGNKEKETLKAQAVIARTNIYRRIEEGESLYDILKKEGNDEKTEKTERFTDAAKETEDLILTWKGKLRLVPYHAVSGGKTRDGEEAFHDKAYTYLKSVDSDVDKESPEYLSSFYMDIKKLPKEFKIEKRDTAGYVESICADGNILEGEGFRQGMNLSSSNFTIQEVGDQYRFLCKGKGHGLGFSQYGGNELAKKGKTFQEILSVYFPEMEQTEIDKVL